MKNRVRVLLTLIFFLIALSASLGHVEEFSPLPGAVSCSCFAQSQAGFPAADTPNICASDIDEYSGTTSLPTALLTPRLTPFIAALKAPQDIRSAEMEILPPIPIV